MFSLDLKTRTIEHIPWSENQPKDFNNPHIHRNTYTKSVVLNNRVYMFSNLSETNPTPLKIIDFSLRQLFPINSKEFKPSCSRINYSLSNYKNKIFLYAGLNEQNKLLDSMDDFDAYTYKFSAVKYRGDFIPKGR